MEIGGKAGACDTGVIFRAKPVHVVVVEHCFRIFPELVERLHFPLFVEHLAVEFILLSMRFESREYLDVPLHLFKEVIVRCGKFHLAHAFFDTGVQMFESMRK